MSVKVKCPNCGDTFWLNEDELWWEVECIYCEHHFKAQAPPRRQHQSHMYMWLIGIIAALFIAAHLLWPDEEEPGPLWLRNELMAQREMRAIAAAQQIFKERYGTYTTLNALREERLLDAHLAYATGDGLPKWGYRYFVETEGTESWFVVAVPAEPGISGTESYYLDQRGVMCVVRYEKENDPPAGPDSPEME